MENKARNRIIMVSVAVVAAAGIGVGAFMLTRNHRKDNPQPDSQLQTQASTIPTATTSPHTTPSTQPTATTHEHSYITEKKAATCTSEGYTLHACSCGDTYRSDEKKATGHEYGDAVQTESTCTAKGGLVRTCETCGHKDIKNAIAALGHNWSAWEIIKEATTSASGQKVRTCDRCNKTEKKTIAKTKEVAHKHSYTETVVEATCVKKGYTLHSCACGKSYKSATTPLRSHLYGDWVTTKKPTATSEGKKEATCQWCGRVTSKSIPKLSAEDVKLYEKYIDPKIEIRRLPDGAIDYSYKDVSLTDTRSWGDPPYLRVTNSGGIHFIYAKKDGTKVEWTVEPFKDYIRWLVIHEDGTYTVSLVGDFDD